MSTPQPNWLDQNQGLDYPLVSGDVIDQLPEDWLRRTLVDMKVVFADTKLTGSADAWSLRPDDIRLTRFVYLYSPEAGQASDYKVSFRLSFDTTPLRTLFNTDTDVPFAVTTLQSQVVLDNRFAVLNYSANYPGVLTASPGVGSPDIRVFVTVVWDEQELNRIFAALSPPGNVLSTEPPDLDHRLNAKVFFDQSSRVQALKFNNDAANRRGSFELEAGTNFSITADRPSGAVSTALTFNAIAGAGAGRVPVDCGEDSLFLRTISTRAPDQYGNFTLSGSACYWLQNGQTANTIKLHNDCTTCLDCDLIVDGYNNLLLLREQAASIRQRLCAAIEAYNYYIGLVQQLVDALEETKVTFSIIRSTGVSHTVIVRLQTGTKTITKIQVQVAYAAPTLTSELHEYSFADKIPGLAPLRRRREIRTPSNPDTGNVFDGTEFVYDATGESVPAEATALKPYKFASWHWNMFFARGDAGTTVDITYVATVTYSDASTQTFGPILETVDIDPPPP